MSHTWSPLVTELLVPPSAPLTATLCLGDVSLWVGPLGAAPCRSTHRFNTNASSWQQREPALLLTTCQATVPRENRRASRRKRLGTPYQHREGSRFPVAALQQTAAAAEERRGRGPPPSPLSTYYTACGTPEKDKTARIFDQILV